MAKSGEEVDFDFFDSPRTSDRNERNVEKNAARSRKSDTSARDDVSESTVTSAKPPTHPNSAAKRGRNRDESSDSEGRDSPRSNASASTAQSRRTIETKIPSAGQQHDSDDDYDDKNDDNSDDGRNGRRSRSRRSHSSSSSDESSSMRSATPNGKAQDTKATKYNGRGKSNSISSRGSVSSKEEPKAKNRDSEREKAKKKKSSYLSDDSDGSDVDITDTDSDVTEVSPLNSPHKPPTLPRQKSAKPRPVRNVSATHNRKGQSANINNILSAHRDTMDLKVLLQTVLDMENEASAGRSRRVAPGTGASSGDFCRQRRNYSFTNEQVMRIDRENQRLMENIMRKAREAKKVKQELKMAGRKQTSSTPSRPTSSAINRFRQQQKIEVENLGILRRLQQTRPTRDLQRNVQIDEYKKQLVFAGCAPLSSIQPRTKSSFARYADSSTSETQFHDGTDGDTMGRRRPHSAFVTRPKSGKRPSSTVASSRPRSATLKNKKESKKDLQDYDDEYSNDFEVDDC